MKKGGQRTRLSEKQSLNYLEKENSDSATNLQIGGVKELKRQDLEAKRDIIKVMAKLADELERFEFEASDVEIDEDKESIWDLYIPGGLRNQHKSPKPML